MNARIPEAAVLEAPGGSAPEGLSHVARSWASWQAVARLYNTCLSLLAPRPCLAREGSRLGWHRSAGVALHVAVDFVVGWKWLSTASDIEFELFVARVWLQTPVG